MLLNRASAVFFLAALVLASYWPLAFSQQYTYLDYGDLVFQVLPWMQVQACAWHSGVFPLWDPFVWSGQPLLGQSQPGAAFPLNWPLFLSPLGEDQRLQLSWVHWHFVAMHVLAALFAYGWIRTQRGSRFAAVFAGLGFATVGYVGSIWWPQMLNGAIWIPVTFLLARRAAASRGRISWAWAQLCGGATGLAFLSGHHQAPLLGGVALASYVCFLIVRRTRERGRLLLRFGAAAAVAGLTAGLQLLPAIEYGRLAYRWVGLVDPVTFEQSVPLDVHRTWSFTVSDLRHLIVPIEGFEVSPHVGVAVLGLALFAVACGKKKRETWYFAGLAVFGTLYTLGPSTPVHRAVYQLVPLADKARSPEQAIYIAQFALITLAAFGFDRIHWRRRELQTLLLVLLFAEGASGRFTRIRPISDAPILDMLSQYDEALDYLAAQPRPFRFLIRAENKPNVGAWRGLEDTNGYLASVSRDLYDFFGRDWRGAELTMNTVYEVAREPFDPSQEEVFRGASGWNVYRNPEAKPRVWFRDAPEGCDASATYDRIDLQRIEIEVETGCAARLVIADPVYPGWRAAADGEDVEIEPFQGALMQIGVQPGKSRIELVYRPLSALAGAAMSLAGLVLCLAALGVLVRRRRATMLTHAK